MADFVVPEHARPAIMDLFDGALADLMLHDPRLVGRSMEQAQLTRTIFAAMLDGSLSPEDYKLLRETSRREAERDG